MLSSQRLSMADLLRLSQLDKIILTLAVTCALPLCLHALPSGLGETLGPRWLPIFYAPLVASLCFRPHVTLIVCLLAPIVNHALFQMPSTQLLPLLMSELLVFNGSMALLKRWFTPAGWQAVPAYFLALFLGLLTGGHVPLEHIGTPFLQSVWTAAPGIIILTVMAEFIGGLQKRAQG